MLVENPVGHFLFMSLSLEVSWHAFKELTARFQTSVQPHITSKNEKKNLNYAVHPGVSF